MQSNCQAYTADSKIQPACCWCQTIFIGCAHVVDPFSTVLPPTAFVCETGIVGYMHSSPRKHSCGLAFFTFSDSHWNLRFWSWDGRSKAFENILARRFWLNAFWAWRFWLDPFWWDELWLSVRETFLFFLAGADISFSWNASASGFLLFLFVLCVVALNFSPNSCQFLFNIML